VVDFNQNVKIDEFQVDNNLDDNLPILFDKKSKIIKSKQLSYIKSDTGKTRHYTPAAQE